MPAVDWDKATYEALQEDTPRSVAILSDQHIARLETLESENFSLRESLDEVRMQFALEDNGWQLISAFAQGEHLEGLDLDELKEISEKIRPHVVGDALPARGASLHAGYVWSKGLNIEGVKDSGGAGRKSELIRFYQNVVNQENLFSALAHEELQRGRFADGNIFIACDKSTKTARVIPLNQITALRVNPDHPSEVWMYQRTWDPKVDEKGPRVVWYYTNRFSGTKRKSVTVNGKTQPIDQDVTLIDRKFNRVPGFVLGLPDATAGMIWASAYTEILQYGKVVNESLAKILFKVVSKKPAGAASAGVKIAGMSGHGNAATMTEGQDLQAVSTAGRGYDFVSPRPVAAMAAAAWNVSNMDLLNDSSAAGSSYGSANALAPANKNAMRLMQREWISLFEEIFDFFSLGRPRIWFEELDEVDQYRAAQGLTLLSPTLSDEEYRSKALDLLDIPGDPGKTPPTLVARTQGAQQAASPDQGQSNGTGGSDSGSRNDLRTDNIESVRVAMENENFLARYEELVIRAENASR